MKYSKIQRNIQITLILAAMLAGMTGCSLGETVSPETDIETAVSAVETETVTEPETEAITEAPAETEAETDAPKAESSDTETKKGYDTEKASDIYICDASALDYANMFTKRDESGSYDEEHTVNVTLGGSVTYDGTGVTVDGKTVTLSEEGTYIFSGTLSDSQITVAAGDSDKVQIVLSGADITNSDGPAILVRTADKVFVTLADGTDNILSDTGAAYIQPSDVTSNVDGVIFSKQDLVINGGGNLTVNAGYAHGIVGKDDLKITGGSITVTAKEKGIEANDSIRVENAVISITAGDDGIHSDNDEDTGKGYVYIRSGSITVSSGDDGIHAATALVIDGGNIDITKSYEGLEGDTIDINGGIINVVASDDGINAAMSTEISNNGGGNWFGGRRGRREDNDGSIFGGIINTGYSAEQTGANVQTGFWGGGWFDAGNTDSYIRITSGVINVNAGGDGVDSNGMLYVDGGELYVSGPTSSMDGALDYETGGIITGGTVVAAGSAGMAENFSSGSTQYSILVNLSSTVSGGTEVTLSDSAGKVILSYTPEKNYQSVVFSCPDITTGTYTVTAGDITQTVEVSSIITTSGSRGFGGFGGGRR